MIHTLARFFIRLFAICFFKLTAKVTIEGVENIPASGPLIVVANHFSLFEVPLLGLYLPYMPTFMGAAELRENKLMAFGMELYQVIPVKRGVADHEALKKALTVLGNGGVVSIFPEGGITAEAVQVASQGLSTNHMTNHSSRLEATLISARPGTAYMALKSGAPLLPVSFLGTEKLEGHLQRYRGGRVPIHIKIGPVFGPLKLEEIANGRGKRDQLEELGHDIMRRIADLLPPENQGVYGNMKAKI
jgi:1-acyl-sn-glycerol-3-phosphate acyltransferase